MPLDWMNSVLPGLAPGFAVNALLYIIEKRVDQTLFLFDAGHKISYK